MKRAETRGDFARSVQRIARRSRLNTKATARKAVRGGGGYLATGRISGRRLALELGLRATTGVNQMCFAVGSE